MIPSFSLAKWKYPLATNALLCHDLPAWIQFQIQLSNIFRWYHGVSKSCQHVAYLHSSKSTLAGPKR